MNFPAVKTVHWPSGPVNACDVHAVQLIGLADFLGTHVGVTAAPDGSQCGNCQNEHSSSSAAEHSQEEKP